MNILSQIPEGLVYAAFAFAATVGGFKVALNGMRSDVREIKEDIKEGLRVQVQHGERIASLEAARGQFRR